MLSLADNIMRAINFCFFVICMGLIGSLLATEKGHSSRVNYCMFVPPFAVVTDSFYGILANIWTTPFAWPIILFAFDFLNFAFTFTAGTVLSVGIRTHSCKNRNYIDNNKIIQGSTDRCRKAQASIAFFYFSFFIFFVKVVMSAINLLSNGAMGFSTPSIGRRRHHTANIGVPGASSPQVGVPNISQV
ncbi:hypothetical protein Kpol_1017p6 [Vanderwaltozyma polyspora DSM 70294]|uniref:MARVEL domain-containing protein n=1 Tax=Vanderwaltozyma polyspora (strain ATCC 22028 / DSM 70294 / BCRC 21397 / CBS 2163 / NBRC 10782 / NRRL Y-8283 / UCD 57-17) TaxID=436907 RepID=A7TRD3_VANPO|nr:uncharacterized protein Kpol_1017p6 [Vanderwaltozyma polyspora DSM 70294]EDO15172.1 hypothetical protein Kpol_1017p6 [Vanderwaltozyma polyspora DSM 70294]